MAETNNNQKTLITRISLKYDTYSNWTTNNPVLLKGEAAIATIASGDTQEVNSITAPQVLVKIGDGTSNYNALPFISAKAADVYSWAKAATKPEYNAGEIVGIEDYVKGINTTYTFTEDAGKLVITPSEGDAVTIDFTDNYAAKEHNHTVSEITDFDASVKTYDYATKTEAKGYADAKDEAIQAAQDAADAAQDDVDALAELVGDLPEGTSATTVVGYVDAEAAKVAGRVKAIEDDYLKAADKTELTDAIATAKQEAIDAVLDGVTDDFDTLKEVATWIQSDTTNSTQLINRVSAIEADYLKGVDKTELQNSIDALGEFVGDLPEGSTSTTVVAYIQEVVNGLKIGDYAKASDLTALADRVVILEGKAHTHDNAGVLAGITAEQVAAWDAAEGNATDYADGLIEELDSSVAATAEVDNKVSVLTGVTQENGKLTGKTETTLAAIAKTGSTDDLIQGSLTLVFDCGTSEI